MYYNPSVDLARHEHCSKWARDLSLSYSSRSTLPEIWNKALLSGTLNMSKWKLSKFNRDVMTYWFNPESHVCRFYRVINGQYPYSYAN